MSRDSSPTYIHMRSSRFADLFEEFCRPPSASSSLPAAASSFSANPNSANAYHHPRDPTNLHSVVGGVGGANNNSGSSYANVLASNDGMIQIPGSFLPYEEIPLPPHLMPVNPEDEDDVVPDMHAAFGIQQALGAQNAGAEGSGRQTAVRGEERWRDLGLEGLLNGTGGGGGLESGSGGSGGGGGGGVGGGTGRLGDLGVPPVGSVNGGVGGTTMARREGRRTGILLMR